MIKYIIIVLLSIQFQHQAFSNCNTVIDSIGANIEFRNLIPSKFDSIQVNFWEDYFMGSPSQTISISKIFSGTDPNFRLHIPKMNRPGYLQIIGESNTKKQLHEQLFLVVQGDQITITIHPDSLSFIGNSTNKYIIVQKIGDLKKKQQAYIDDFKRLNNKEFSTFADELNTYFEAPLNLYLSERLALLEQEKKNLPKQVYRTMKANLIGQEYHERHQNFLKMKSYGLVSDSSQYKQFKDIYNENLVPLKSYNFKTTDLLFSDGRFLSYLYLKARLDVEFKIGLPDEEKDLFYYYKKNFKGKLREKLMVDFLLWGIKYLNEHQEFLIKTHEFVKTPSYKKILIGLENRPQINEPAFNFKLEDTNGNIVTLESLRGKVIFIDFWYTGCQWCAVYYNTQLKNIEHYFKDNPNIQFITVSIDLDREKWIESVNSGKYTSNEVLNLYTMGMGSRHHIIKHYRIRGYPHPLIIDKQGRNLQLEGIRQMEKSELIAFIEAAINK